MTQRNSNTSGTRTAWRYRRLAAAWALAVGAAYGGAATASSVLVSGSELERGGVIGYLEELGHSVTLVATDQFALTPFDGYDAIYLDWNSAYPDLATRKSDLSAFVTGGGNLLAEVTIVSGNAVSDYPFGEELTLGGAHANIVRIVDSAHPLMQGLTDAGLSDWGNSHHGHYLSDIGSFSGIADVGVAGNWAVITRPLGAGNVVYMSLDPSYHIKFGSGPIGASSAKGVLIDNALRLPANASTSEVAVADAAGPENDPGGQLRFTVSLSMPAATPVTLQYHTEDGSALAAEDYAEVVAGTLTIPAGDTSATIGVPVVGDTLHEGDETFLVIIDSVSGAELAGGDDQAEGTILNDDAAPTVSIALSATRVYEDPDRRRPSSTITATLSEASGLDTVIDFALSGTATVDVDYTLPALVVPAGQTQASVNLTVIEDEINERVETATLSFAGVDYEVEIHSKRARSGRRGR